MNREPLHRPLEHHARSTFRRNAAWQFSERSARIGLGFLLATLLARNLGPRLYGTYNYGMAIIAMFSFLAQAGLDAVLVRELVIKPCHARNALVSAAILRILGALLAAAVSISISILAAPASAPNIPLLVAIFSCTGFIQAICVGDLWLQAKGAFRQSATAKILAYAFGTTCRIGVLLVTHDIILIAAAGVLESASYAVLLWLTYKRCDQPPRNSPVVAFGALVGLAKIGLPVMLSAFAVAIYSRVDVLMLGWMSGPYEAGQYSAGSLFSEGFYVVPAAIVSAAAPRLSSLFLANEFEFRREFQRMLRICILLGLVVAVTTTVIGPTLIQSVFGNEFVPAGRILQLHIWSTWSVFVGFAADQWYINHEFRYLLLARTASAAVVNIALNWILIPMQGGVGAAIATVVAYTFSSIFFSALPSKTRPLFYAIIRAALPKLTRLQSHVP